METQENPGDEAVPRGDLPEQSQTSSNLVSTTPSLGRNSDALLEVMRRRRENCQEFESVPEGSKADVLANDDATSGKSKPTSSIVYESVPEGSKADVLANGDVAKPTSSIVFESVPEGSKADVVAAGDNFLPTTSSIVFESVPGGSTADALAGSSSSAPSGARRSLGGKIRHTSNNELNSWMEQLRDKCEVLESTPESAVADAIANNEDSSTQRKLEVEVSPQKHEIVFSPPPISLDHSEGTDTTRLHKRSRDELNDWMTRMRNRCAILESMPTATTADAKHEEIEVRTTSTSSFTPKERSARQRVASGPTATSGTSTTVDPPSASDSLIDVAIVCESLQAGPLTHTSRTNVWKSQLDIRDDTEEPSMSVHVPQSFLDAFGGRTGSEDILFDASDSLPCDSLSHTLVASFFEKYFSWAPCHPIAANDDDAARASAVSFFAALARLLRYHSPMAASSIESAAIAHGLDLAGVMGLAIGEHGFKDLIFSSSEDSHLQSLLHICDYIIVEDEELLFLFVVATRLAQVEIELHASLDVLKGELCRAVRLEGVAGLACSVQDCISDSLHMLDATPVTLMSLLAGGHAAARLTTPMCTVAPDELLHHIYGKTTRPWRLVVVDARMTSSDFFLPVCIRLGRTPHKQRRQILREMPYEESIHLCFMGDGIPSPGDDAFELCKHLMGSAVKRKHVSVVEGGWSAVEELARSLKLDLMSADPDSPEKPKQKQASGFKHELKQELKQARAAAREAAAEIAQATETATKASQKVAQRMWAGAGRAFQMLSGDSVSGTQKTTDKASKKPAQNVDI